MRLFIAIQLPDPLREEIAQWMKALAQALPDPQHRLRWVKNEQLHLTLKFLGETREDQVPPLSSALREAADTHTRFPMSLSKVGHFGGRIIWLGIQSGAENAAILAQSIDTRSEGMGFISEKRPFHPHITLARSKVNPGNLHFANLPSTLAQTTFGPFTVSEITLVQSTLSPRGSTYDILGKYPLS